MLDNVSPGRLWVLLLLSRGPQMSLSGMENGEGPSDGHAIICKASLYFSGIIHNLIFRVRQFVFYDPIALSLSLNFLI